MRQILFIQGGGGHAVHDQWDNKLVASLKRELGDGFDVRYPRMPDEDDPKYARWKPAIEREVDALNDGAVVVGHSIGGTMLVNALAEGVKEGTDENVLLRGQEPRLFSSQAGPLPSQGTRR